MSKKRCHFCEDLKMLKSKVDTPIRNKVGVFNNAGKKFDC